MIGDKGELPIAMALASVVATHHMDELARVFVTLFDAKHLLYQLLWNMFSKEVSLFGACSHWAITIAKATLQQLGSVNYPSCNAKNSQSQSQWRIANGFLECHALTMT